MKLTLKDVVEINEGIAYLMTKEMSPGEMYDVLKIQEVLEPEIKIINKLREESREKNGVAGKQESPEKFEQFKTEFEKVLEKEIELTFPLVSKKIITSQKSFMPMYYKALKKIIKD